VWNPPYELLGEVCEKQSAMWLRVAALMPRLGLHVEPPTSVGDATLVRARVSNVGYLGTYVTHAGKDLDHNEGLWADLVSESIDVLTPTTGRIEIGHLDGWGRGMHGGAASIHFVRSRGTGNASELAWTVRGSGPLTIRIGSRRVGWIEETITI
jgi:hypothetical protein